MNEHNENYSVIFPVAKGMNFNAHLHLCVASYSSISMITLKKGNVIKSKANTVMKDKEKYCLVS